ncbi:MAG: hypothetical protein ABIN91_12885 [Mucilaginibacter sp.]|uniref:hypothetical protein n=1 Tax=Mucilaginibacter sp. TaxID=1882438 RepID=UPI003262DC2F
MKVYFWYLIAITNAEILLTLDMSFTLASFFPSGNLVNEPFLTLDSPQWKELEGGYRRVKYDASVALKKLEQAIEIKIVKELYLELWNELHHQGDVGPASYYAVPHLVRIALETKLIDYNVLALVSVIEIQRHKNNPPLPKAFATVYTSAISQLQDIVNIILEQDWNLDLTNSALTAMALAKGQLKLAEAIFGLDSDDRIDEVLEIY